MAAVAQTSEAREAEEREVGTAEEREAASEEERAEADCERESRVVFVSQVKPNPDENGGEVCLKKRNQTTPLHRIQ